MNSCIANVNQHKNITPDSPKYYKQDEKVLNNNFGINNNLGHRDIGNTSEQNKDQNLKKNFFNANSAVNIKEDNYMNSL